jgi:Beta-galactosidase
MSTRRSFFKHMVAGVACYRMTGGFQPSVDALAQTGPASVRPNAERLSWLREGIIAAAYWEPLEFYIRRGDAPQDVAKRWKEDFNEATVKRYKELGVNLLIMPLHKGMGLKAEAESIDATRNLTEIAHLHGIRVAGYVGSTMFYETFYSEEPDGPSWEQVDARGRPVYYNNDQTFRHVACRNNPGYRAFIQRVVRLGIEDIKLDLFHFDQLHWWAEPWSCHCKYCLEGFRTYLRKKYRDDQLKARLGFVNLQGIRVPDFNLNSPPVSSPSELKDPLRQEWARFRCASLAEWWEEVHEYIGKLNPDVALLGNPTMTPANNCGFIYGVDLQQLLLHSEFIWTEEENQPRWTSDGRLVSMIRSYKSVRSMGKSLFITQGVEKAEHAGFRMEGPPILRLAEAIAYNDLNMGVVVGGWEFGSNRLTPQTQRYVDFFRSHNKDLVETAPVTDVAIFRSFASIQFNPGASNVSTMLFEQTLIQCKFPFGIIFDTHLNDLSKYRVLVLANQDALSDEQIEQIRRFVEAGGGLVATGQTSMQTEWRKKRDRFGLADVLGIEVPPDDEMAVGPVRREFGKGRVAYLPRIEPEIVPPAAMMSHYFTNQYWKLPKNYEDLADAVRWVARQEFSVHVEAPLWVTIELAEQKRTNTWLLHLLNFKVDEPLADIPVQIRTSDGMRLREAVLESPDGLERQTLRVSTQTGGASFLIPKLGVYDLVLMQMEKA